MLPTHRNVAGVLPCSGHGKHHAGEVYAGDGAASVNPAEHE
jgi:hypothetical protein